MDFLGQNQFFLADALGMKTPMVKLGLVADPVIEAIARLEFEDGLRTGVLPGGCWYPCGGRT